MSIPQYVVLANPGSKRWETYDNELHTFWAERGTAPDIALVLWSTVIPRDGNLAGLPEFDAPALVRLESPGRDFEVTKLLLEAGGRACPSERQNWSALQYRKGRQLCPSLMYAGFRRVLQGLRSSFDTQLHLRPLACPLAIAEMFDKNATSRRLREAGLPCPAHIVAPPTASELLANLREHRFSTAYVKLNTGSSASAIAVVHALDDPEWADTTLVRIEGDYYSSRRLNRCSGDELTHVLQFLLDEGACVQQGIRMAQMDGQNFDVRVVVIHGEPAFTIFRLSSLPMTNLHLGGRRGDPIACRAAIPTRAWLDAIDDCVEAAALYESAIVGVDVVFETGYSRHYILELNAFGDFFPGLTDAEGRTVHGYEIEKTLRVNETNLSS